MPVTRCQLNNKPGYKWGSQGKCYTYDPESPQSENIAKKKARDQGIASFEYFREIINRLNWIVRRKKK